MSEPLVAISFDAYDRIAGDPFALALLMNLRRNCRDDDTFAIPNGMAEAMGWARKRFAAARAALQRADLIEVDRLPSRNGAGLYRFCGPR